MCSKNKTSNSRIIGFDFFCGCGGVTHGFLNSGIKMVAGIDINPSMKYAYESNNTPSKFYNININNLEYNIKLIKKITESLKYKNIIFAACAPCQPFSNQNKNYLNDSRNSLLLSFSKLLSLLPNKLLPDAIFVENVGSMKKRGSLILNSILLNLDKLGFLFLEPKVLNAKDFGVPQSRKRLIFVAIKRTKLKKPDLFNWDHFYSYYCENLKTVEQAIGHLPYIKAGEAHPLDYLHVSRKLSQLNLDKIKKITRPGGSRDMWDSQDILNCHKNYSGHKDVYGRMSWDKPSPTLTTKCVSISNGRYGHPVQNRAISLREAAILQSMGDYDFEKPVNSTLISEMIGNAVPPKLANKFGDFILKLIQ